MFTNDVLMFCIDRIFPNISFKNLLYALKKFITRRSQNKNKHLHWNDDCFNNIIVRTVSKSLTDRI